MIKYICCLFLGLPLIGSAQSFDYTVKGAIGTYDAPAKVYLVRYAGDQRLIDSWALKHGTFSSHGRTGLPEKAFVLLTKDGSGGRRIADRKLFYIDTGSVYL